MDRRKFIRTGGAALLASQILGPDALAGLSSEESSAQIHPKDSSVREGGLLLRFLGTGAADWNGPDGRGEHRRLTSILLDNRVLIDFTPSDEDMLPQGCRPETIFYTHSHGDHYNPKAALTAGVRSVYMGESWFKRCRAGFRKACRETGIGMPELHPMPTGSSACVCGITFTALPANHATSDPDEETLMYLVEKRGTRLLYATDTGGIMARAARLAGIDAHMAEGKAITALVMEATMGLGHDSDFRIFTHSSVDEVKRTADILLQTGRYTPAEGQPVYLTHLARTLHGTQAELDAELPSPLKAACDGLEVIFN
ncbi:MAG: MBL fold metallo-hydrolase [Bacteroidales bacterium]|nr:MBL fold metallo-hydrolase [Bacteroidales bacterium]